MHSENNNPSDPNLNESIINDQDLQNRQNLSNMYNLYTNYFQKTFNSIISQNFTNILRYEMKCQNCSSYYNFNYKNILEFDVDEYRKNRDEAFPQKTGMKLNMDECFTNFIGGHQNQCIFCNNNGLVFTNICIKNKILIIAFKRENHGCRCDIDFPNKFNISKYCSKENFNGINSYTIYILRSCISLNNNGQFLSDICINNKWFRFINNQINLLGNENDIRIFEPQLLIYEQENNNKNSQNQQRERKIRNNINMIRPSIMNPNMMKPYCMMRPNMGGRNMGRQNCLSRPMMRPNMMGHNMMRPNFLSPHMMRPNMMRPNMMRPNMMNPNMMNPNI